MHMTGFVSGSLDLNSRLHFALQSRAEPFDLSDTVGGGGLFQLFKRADAKLLVQCDYFVRANARECNELQQVAGKS